MMRSTDQAPTDHLLELSPSGSGISPRLLEARGGFLWWYLDLVDPEGNGLVLIWSYGLPFLPGYASAARRDEAPRAAQRPSLTLSTYRQGELDFYLLQEFHPDEVQWETHDVGDTWRFAGSIIHSDADDQSRSITVDLKLDVPQHDQPVGFTLGAMGPGCRLPDTTHDPSVRRDDNLPDHDWVPLLTGLDASATLSVDGINQYFDGRLYHDRNGGKRPLHDLGLQSWAWGRIPLPDRDFIYYVLDGKDGSCQTLLLTIGQDGTIKRLHDASFSRDSTSKNLGGLTWWPTMSVRGSILTPGDISQMEIFHDDVVDSGPFYLRSVPTARLPDGSTFRGIAEFCEPDRIDLDHHRPLVRMRVHQRGGRNSMWLPLFTGPSTGRVQRLVQSWLPL